MLSDQVDETENDTPDLRESIETQSVDLAVTNPLPTSENRTQP